MDRELCCEPHPLDLEELERIRAEVDEEGLWEMAEVFKALGDPTRLRILKALSISPMCVCDLAHLTGLSVSAISHQLRLLRAMRLVKGEKIGRRVFYSLHDDHIAMMIKLGQQHIREERG